MSFIAREKKRLLKLGHSIRQVEHIMQSTGLRHYSDVSRDIRAEPKNPIYDPRRDGYFESEDTTASLMGDPAPGRRELMEKNPTKWSPRI